jgi:hypothetical protein
VRELTDKSSLDPSLASNALALGNDNPSPYRAIVENRPYGLEIVRQARIIRLETVRAVEAVRGRVEVRVGLRLIFAGHLQFTCPCQMGNEFIDPEEQNRPKFARGQCSAVQFVVL